MSAIAFSPDGKTIATGGWDKLVCLWDAQTLRRLATLQGHGAMVLSVAFAPDGSTLASGSFDKTVRLWDLKVNPPRERLVLPHQEPPGVCRVAFSPDGKTIASGCFSIRLWDLSTEKPTQRARMEMGSGVSALTFARDGKTLVAADRSQVVLWDLDQGAPVKRATLVGGDVFTAAVFSPDERILACGGLNPVVQLWDLVGKKPRK